MFVSAVFCAVRKSQWVAQLKARYDKKLSKRKWNVTVWV